jgi:hypothetical protein
MGIPRRNRPGKATTNRRRHAAALYDCRILPHTDKTPKTNPKKKKRERKRKKKEEDRTKLIHVNLFFRRGKKNLQSGRHRRSSLNLFVSHIPDATTQFARAARSFIEDARDKKTASLTEDTKRESEREREKEREPLRTDGAGVPLRLLVRTKFGGS